MTAAKQYCPACGAPVEAQQGYCGQCGEALTAAGQPQRTASEATPRPARVGRTSIVIALVGSGILLAALAAYFAIPRDSGSPERVQTTSAPQDGVKTKPKAGPGQVEKKQETATGSPGVPAGGAAGQEWRTYTNARYGVVVDYPAHIFTKMQDEPADHSGRAFSGSSGLWFYIYSHANALDQTIEDVLRHTLVEVRKEYTLSSASRTDGFDVVFRRDGEIIWRHMLTSQDNGFHHWLEIGTPESGHARLRPVADRMIASFRVDRPGGPRDEDVAVDAFSYRTISSRDYGFKVEGHPTDASFSVDVPEGWIREEAGGAAHELVFKSPDNDPDAMMFLAFTAEPLRGRSAEAKATAQAKHLQEIGGAEIVDKGAVSVGSLPGYRIQLKVVSPSDLDTKLVDTIIVLKRGKLLYTLEMTAPEPIWHTAGLAIERAVKTLAFKP